MMHRRLGSHKFNLNEDPLFPFTLLTRARVGLSANLTVGTGGGGEMATPVISRSKKGRKMQEKHSVALKNKLRIN